MVAQFKKHITTQALFSKEDKILLAVSGGKDSVLMSRLFAEAGYTFVIAHCNFKLRGVASDEDALFVRALAKELGVACLVEEFDTEHYAASQKISIQMAARELRYDWLEKTRRAQSCAYIATAHHLNDSLETVLYNFTKGCGIRGLHGILPKQGQIIRPLLFAEASAIVDYIQNQQIPFREDASNASDKYSRNFIRHQVIPKLKKLNPAFEKTASTTIQRIRETEFIFHEAIAHYKKQVLSEQDGHTFIAYQKIPKAAASTILYELLCPMHFNAEQVDMLLHQEHQSGVRFQSATHELLIDRGRYIIRRHTAIEAVELVIEEGTTSLDFQGKRLSFVKLEELPEPMPKAATIALLDYGQLVFPLRLRPWRAGDIFQPFGMGGQHQKVQDFLTHRKLSRFEKEQAYVLESGGKICWVVGFRIDERFRIRATSTCVLQVEWG